ncbi:hypothetical protein [Humisphaera borealis]|uniref:Uncharacterized protein n=1 Tax=Humisphaera borealis TaxID=2807512 RepID=A0A7M2WUZ0_9BACT|nr:hypothetical protein [Humisphaera borealis]QOV89276.1 hypothetical protein IPV69_24220 [Humisphaera borealis]
MELVKKNILSIICGVVALAAIIFHFVVTSGGFSDLETKGKARAAKQAELKNLRSAEYVMPTISDAPPVKLERFPNEKAIKDAEGLVNQLAAQAKGLVEQAVRINRQPYNLIVPESLPMPTDPRKYEFREQYNLVLKPGGKPKTFDTKNPVVNLADDILQSAVPPTDAEILDAKNKLWKDEHFPKLIMVNGVPVNQKEVVSEFLRATAKFEEEFRRKRAMSFKVYLEPNALAISPRLDLAGRTAPAAEDIWFAQMSLWVQQDVCAAIARMNARSTNIPASVVKHLVAVDVRQDSSMYVVPGGLAAAPAVAAAPSSDGGEAPADAGAAPAAVGKDFALSPTGRVCNPLYDVVQFELVVVVDRQYIKDFLEQLQFGRFIAVLDTDMQNIDLDDAVSQGYDYGSRPVVELRVKCESLFLREWTAYNNGPMPQSVRTMLRVAPPPAAVPAPQPDAVVQQ